MAATEPGRPSGAEARTADLISPRPRVSTRVLVVATLVVAVLLVVSLVVAFLVLHQPRLTQVPVPSVSSIA